MAYGQKNEAIIIANEPKTKAAGNKCTIFKVSGYKRYNEIRDIPNI